MMDDSQKPDFYRLLAAVLASYAKPLPEKVILASWWENLKSFPIGTVEIALQAYCDDNSDFAPAPVGIAKRCRLMDGRPGPEEAYALALATIDEQNTVVWTQECAEAFAKAKPVLDASGAISARKAFIEIYERLVSAARQRREPVNWFTSPGLDKIGYEAAVKQATVAGLLLAPPVTHLLDAPVEHQAPNMDPRKQIEYLRKALLDGVAEKQRRADAEIDAANAARNQAEHEISAAIQSKVDQHLGGGRA